MDLAHETPGVIIWSVFQMRRGEKDGARDLARL